MTDKPLVKYVIQNDTTKQAADSLSTDSLQANKNLSKREIRKLEKEKEKELKAQEKQLTEKDISSTTDSTENKAVVPIKEPPKVDTAYMTADTLFSKVIFVRDYRPLDLKLDRNGGQLEDTTEVDYGDIDQVDLFETGDSSVVEEVGAKELTQVGPARKEATTLKPAVKKAAGRPVAKPKPVDSATIQATTKADSVLRRNAVMPTGQEQDSLMRKALQSAQTADTLLKDSTEIYADTARTRIVKAYYNVRVFKSDLQAVADSVYYGMVDSMFRFMGSPMIWSEGSQINADTIYMQIKNNKMDNALLKDNAFMVNAVLDTLKFNQLKGRKITAFFANNNIDRLFVDGNAENLVFSTNDKTNTITEMFHDRSSRIKV